MQDGDEFGIIWDTELLPRPDQIIPPADYAKLASNKTEPKDLNVNDQEGLARSYSACVKSNVLGRIANLHLALCDMQPAGACDELAIELAKAQSVAVDAAKTGRVVEVPWRAKEMVKRRGYPDFMSANRETYISEKPLGMIYHRANETITDNVANLMISRPDPELLVEGYLSFLEKARSVYQAYCCDLKVVLNKLNLQHEEELFLGRALEWHPLFESNKGRAMQVMCFRALEFFLASYKLSRRGGGANKQPFGQLGFCSVSKVILNSSFGRPGFCWFLVYGSLWLGC